MTLFQKEQIQRMLSEGMGYSKIASCLNISVNTIKSYCRRNDLGGMAEVSQDEENTAENEMSSFCKNCGKPIKQIDGVKQRKFCSDKCRMAWWNSNTDMVNRKAIYHLECAGCSKPFNSYGNKKRKYCCHSCYIKDRFGKQVEQREVEV
jgi:uncharacterized protein YjcR